MGHDIYGINRSGKEVAYARFSMWNHNANILYDLLDAQKYNGGVSGIGATAVYTRQEIEKALHDFRERFKKDIPYADEDWIWDRKQILEFMENCLTTAREEGSVRIVFF